MVVITSGGVQFYIDARLQKSLDRIKLRVNTKDEDYFFAVDGEEGAGKSVLTLQLAKYCDPSFTLDRVVFDAKQFQDAIISAHKGQAIVFDEAFRGLSSRGALSEINKILVSVMMECRQKNLFVFIVLPSVFLLDKYVALHRSKGLFHVYKKDGRRGQWRFYNKKKLKILYLTGKVGYSYRGVKTNFRGMFTDVYTVPEDEYRTKKRDALTKTAKNPSAAILMNHRNVLLWFLNRECGVPMEQLSLRLKEFGMTIEGDTIKKSVLKAERDMVASGILLSGVDDKTK